MFVISLLVSFAAFGIQLNGGRALLLENSIDFILRVALHPFYMCELISHKKFNPCLS